MSNATVPAPDATCQRLLDNLPGLVAHARKHLLATLDELAGDVVEDGGLALDTLTGIFEALHALRAIDVELEAPGAERPEVLS